MDAVDQAGNFSINRPMVVTCDGMKISNSTVIGVGGGGSVTVAAGDVVILRGLSFEGSGSGGGGGPAAGLSFNGAGTLVLDNVKLSGWPGSGVLFRPNGPARLVVSNSLFAGNGAGTTGAAIRVAPTGTAFAQVAVEHSVVSGNVFGIAGDGTAASGGGINVTVADSLVSANSQDGIVAVAGGAEVNILVDLTRIVNNVGNGIRSTNASSVVRVTRSALTGNSRALTAVGGGQLLSSGSNVVENNAVEGTFTGSFATK